MARNGSDILIDCQKALDAGTRDGPEIREALRREPSRTQLS
jgi:hypothetical protein